MSDAVDFVFAPAPPVTLAVAGSDLRFPVARVFCIGRNYRWDANEPAPQQMPAWFMKPATAVVPAIGDLPYPPETAEFCHEVELVVAIGRGGRDLSPAQAEADHIWGYAVGLDLTRRDLQQQAKQAGGPWEPAKAFDHSAPCTPIVPSRNASQAVNVGTANHTPRHTPHHTADHPIEHPSHHPKHGALWLAVNGVERQRSDVSQLLWPVPELVAMLSRSVALLPGDLIYTGTPAGVGPLQPGDVVTAGVAGIGELCMTVTGHAT